MPHLWKKGQSGNPKGRPPGFSLKEWTRKRLEAMTDEERDAFLEGIPKVEIWKLAEGNPANATDLTSKGEAISFNVVKYGDDKPTLPTESVPDTTA